MSFLVKSSQLGYLSNKEREDFFLSDDEDDDFNFKYVPANQFKNVVKNVRRQKSKMDEERVWASFVRQQEQQEPINASDKCDPIAMHNMKQFLDDSIQEVDRELKRLEEDAMPEMSERPYKGIAGIKNQDGQLVPRKMVQEKPEKKVPVMKDSGTGSTNILLTIPEEENMTSAAKHSSKQKHRLRTNRKSSSDHMMIKRNHSRKLLHIMDDSEYNSSPEPSPDRLSEKEDDIYFRPDPVMAQKVLAMQKKVSMLLDEISFTLDRIPLPDGDRDLLRRQQRVVEFSIRFSRNYLYDLGRQVTEIQRHVRAISVNARPKPTRRGIMFHMQVIGQKLITAHQMLLQALGAYCKHIPSSVARGHPGKLKEILQVVMNLEDICTEVNVTTKYFGSGDGDMQPLGKETQRKCSVILSKLQLRSLGSDNDSQLVSRNTTQSTLVPPPPSAESKKRNERKRSSSRLSMYSMESHLPKNHLSRRPNSSLHRGKKYIAASSKSSNYPLTPEQPNPSPATHKSSKGTLRNGSLRVRLPPREDDIRTMMDTMPADSDPASSVEAMPNSNYYSAYSMSRKSRVPHERTAGKNIPSKTRSCRDPQKPNNNDIIVSDQEVIEKGGMITDEHLSSLVPVIAELMSLVTNKQKDFEIRPVSSASMETLLGFLQKYQFPQNWNNKQTSEKPNKLWTSANPQIKQVHHERDSPKETRSGARNMQLINLPPIEENGEQVKPNEVSCQANYRNSCQTPDAYSELTNTGSNKPGVREPGGVHLVMPMASDDLIPEYQKKYQCFTQSSPMYLSNTHNKPWDVVAWIADKLVDELVVGISKELQMDNVIKKLFDLEFQDF